MNSNSLFGKNNLFRFFGLTLMIGVALCSGILNAAVITHNIGTGNLIIPENSKDDYVIIGTTSSNYVEVKLGYHGSITLKDCSFSFSGYGIHSPIRIVGKNNQSNDHPLTVVNLILDGNNTIINDGGGRACIQVDQGAQINISAIDPCDNNSGKLTAKQINDYGGAAIGSLIHNDNPNETTASAALYNQNGNPTGDYGVTAGGNVVISSGTITARGGHGAGIGGGYTTFYNGMIVIYGGVVDATAIFDAAGIGSGCPLGTGVLQMFAPQSAVIALPPSVIAAKGAGYSASGGVGYDLFSELGLAGTKVRVYIGDPDMTNCPIHVLTEDQTPNANIYVDLSQDPDINHVISSTVEADLLDVHQVFFGTTNSNGVYSTNGKLNNNTTFFTDAISLIPETYGHPYLPKTTTLPSGGVVQLEKLMADFSIQTFPSTPLLLGFTSNDAHENATCVKLVYNDVDPIEDVHFDLANGAATDFDNLVFLAADSSTMIAAPTSLTKGETYYIIIPLKEGKGAYYFSDVLRIIGTWQGVSTSYIRQIVGQIVGDMYTEYICSGNSYFFNGEELTESGIYSNITTTTVQCQALSSVELLNLIVLPPYSSSFEEKVCDKYVWHGTEYTVSGQYQHLYQTSTGCDSIVTLDLTVDHSYAPELDVKDCDQYLWNDINYDVSGTYVQEFTSIHGCDSIVTMHLDMSYTPYFVIEGDHWPIGGTELEWTQYTYHINLEHPLCTVDHVEWSVDCPTMFVFPSDDGLSCDLRIFSYLPPTDSVPLRAVVRNRCGTESNTFWIHTSYHDVDEYLTGVIGLSVFPNPTQDLLNIVMNGMHGEVTLALYDAHGILVDQWVHQNLSDEESIVYNVSSMSDGLYTLKVIHPKQSLVKKILVKK